MSLGSALASLTSADTRVERCLRIHASQTFDKQIRNVGIPGARSLRGQRIFLRSRLVVVRSSLLRMHLQQGIGAALFVEVIHAYLVASDRLSLEIITTNHYRAS